MDKSKKTYVKALNKYNNGYIDKAIDLCEQSISMDIKNAASINLKGLLYYLKGDIDNAQKLWKMNYEINKDGVAERYLINTKTDKEKLYIYKKAVGLIKELHVNAALELLEKCSESDYNYINVNNYKTICYIKKGEYDKAINSLENVMKVDKNNSIAKENKKTLVKYGIIKNRIDARKAVYCLVGVLLVIVIVFGIPAIFRGTKNIAVKFSHNDKTSKSNIQKTPSNNVNKVVKEAPKKVQQESFPGDKIKNDLQNKNYENVYEDYMKWKDKNISNNDKSILASADQLLKGEGVEYFYGRGFNYINSQDYSNAKSYLAKAYELGDKHYLYPHIIYMLGSAFYLSGDFPNGIKYYTQYDEKYAQSDYEEAVLYALAIMYKDSDKTKAADYGQKLVDKYPKSIYNNSVIKSVINR
ncbi:tetratricopeptide repeat protein [Clostridium sp. P21]|uniref:Tetratricopeptide repeat protein n=1 Tax=Clostridium muellerianum TaxID=2716538 RepID=A0A7Y0EEU3_9CLOT|nr:tetratricopeptide repeat protein [Clostridium muellerianum]NMM62184.1 tetratricopeptide repeat protein [Clostridium muellerianum]